MNDYIRWEQLPEDKLRGFKPNTVRGYLEGDERVTVYLIEKHTVKTPVNSTTGALLYSQLDFMYELTGAFLPDDFESVDLNRNHKTLEGAKQTAEEYFERWCRWNFKVLVLRGLPYEELPYASAAFANAALLNWQGFQTGERVSDTKSIEALKGDWGQGESERSGLDSISDEIRKKREVFMDRLKWHESIPGYLQAYLQGEPLKTLFTIENNTTQRTPDGFLLRGAAFLYDAAHHVGIWHESIAVAKEAAEDIFTAWCVQNQDVVSRRSLAAQFHYDFKATEFLVCNVKPCDGSDGMAVEASSGIDALRRFLADHPNMMHDQEGNAREAMRFWVWQSAHEAEYAVEIEARPMVINGEPCVTYGLCGRDEGHDPIPVFCIPVKKEVKR